MTPIDAMLLGLDLVEGRKTPPPLANPCAFCREHPRDCGQDKRQCAREIATDLELAEAWEAENA